jgi:hypothetical protein
MVKKANECSDAFGWQSHEVRQADGCVDPVSALPSSGRPDVLVFQMPEGAQKASLLHGEA